MRQDSRSFHFQCSIYCRCILIRFLCFSVNFQCQSINFQCLPIHFQCSSLHFQWSPVHFVFINSFPEFDGYWTGGIFDGQQWVWQKTKNGVVVKKIMDPDGYSSWGPGQLGDWSDQYNKMAIMRNFVLEPYKWYSLKPWSAAVTMGYICEAEYKLR